MSWMWGGGGDDKKGRKSKGQKSQTSGQQRNSAKAASGRDALNKRANQAASSVGLRGDKKQRFHQYLTSLGNNDLTYNELVDIARRYL